MSGYGDPFCRAAFPWGKEDNELTDFYKKLGQFRKSCPAFKSGDFIPVYSNEGGIAYIRKKRKSEVLVAVNRGNEPCELEIPEKFNSAKVIFGNKPKNGVLNLNKEDFAVLAL